MQSASSKGKGVSYSTTSPMISRGSTLVNSRRTDRGSVRVGSARMVRQEAVEQMEEARLGDSRQSPQGTQPYSGRGGQVPLQTATLLPVDIPPRSAAGS